jgi:hypothetical protein
MGKDELIGFAQFVYHEATGNTLSDEDAFSMLEDYFSQ